MSDIALYNVLTKVGASPEEAERAVADVVNSKEVATKADLRALKSELKEELTWRMVIMAGIILAGVGLMIKFL